MKKIIIKTLIALGVNSSRSKNIVKHIFISFFYKGGAVLANFLMVPLTIDFLDTENYGVWLTLSSFIAWFSFFDIGLGNGLRNKLVEARTDGNLNITKAYISTAYFTIASISLVLFLMFYVLNYFVNWSIFFNTNPGVTSNLSVIMIIVFGCFCLKLIVKLIVNIYQADQNHSFQVKTDFLTQIFSLLIIWLLIKKAESSLLVFAIIFSLLPILILIGLNVFAFSTTYKNLKPQISLWDKKCLKGLMGIGFNFFVIQIAALILFSTDNFIVSKLFGPEDVVPYNVAFKYFSILTMIYTLIINPFWSSFTEAYSKKDYDWVKTSVNKIQKIWFLVPITLIIMILCSNWFYDFWVGEKVLIPLSLSISMALFVLLLTFNMIYVNFINGVGKIKLQLITALISMIINIPLSIFFAKYLDWGVNGVILATCVSLSYSVVLRPIQYYKIINNKAKGIWAR